MPRHSCRGSAENRTSRGVNSASLDVTRAAPATEGASPEATSASREAACASRQVTSAALVATRSPHGVEGARLAEERALRALLRRGEFTVSEARAPAFGDRGKESADRGAKGASRDVSKSSRGAPRRAGDAASASLGLAGASRGVTSASQRTTGASLASIDPALVVAVAHLLARSGAALRPTAPLRVRTVSLKVARAAAFTPRCPLPLEREAFVSASASRGTESASRNTSTDALVVRGVALRRPNSAHDATHEALAASESALLDESEAP
jgi:hypothetical protein